MAYYAANGIPVGVGYTGAATFPAQGVFPTRWTKLDAFVNGIDVVAQILEDEMGWQEDRSQEILLRMGFNSREFPSAFRAVRFKIWSGTLLGGAGTIDITLLA